MSCGGYNVFDPSVSSSVLVFFLSVQLLWNRLTEFHETFRAVESAFNIPVIRTDKSLRFTCPNKYLPVRIIAKTTTNIEIK